MENCKCQYTYISSIDIVTSVVLKKDRTDLVLFRFISSHWIFKHTLYEILRAASLTRHCTVHILNTRNNFSRRVILAGMLAATSRAIIETPLEYAKVFLSLFQMCPILLHVFLFCEFSFYFSSINCMLSTTRIYPLKMGDVKCLSFICTHTAH